MATSTPTSLLAPAVKRLVHDLKEVLHNPVANVSCMPLEDDLFTWHGNVRSGPDGSLQGAPIHFILSFPHTYPHQQPECRLLQPIPHPNVRPATSSGHGGIQVLHTNTNTLPAGAVPGSAAATRPHPIPRQARWRLALWDCIPGKNSWSTAYSVHSIMVQLQVFLLDEDLQYDTQQIAPQLAITKALELNCPDCKHSGADNTINPPFPSDADMAAAKLTRAQQAVAKPFVPARSRTTTLHLKAHQKGVQLVQVPKVSSAVVRPASSSSCSSGGYSAAASSSTSRSSSCGGVGTSCSSSSSRSSVHEDDSAAGDWVTVEGKGKGRHQPAGSSASSRKSPAVAGKKGALTSALKNGRNAPAATNSKKAAVPAATAAKQAAAVPAAAAAAKSNHAGSSSSSNPFAALQSANQLQQQQQPLAAAPMPATPVPGQQQQQSQQLSKAAKKNLARRNKKQQQAESPAAAATASPAEAATNSKGLPPRPTPAAASAAAAAVGLEEWIAAGGKKKAATAAKQQAKAQLYSSPLQQQLKQLQQQPMTELIQQCIAGESFRAAAATADDEVSVASYNSSSTAAAPDLWSQHHYNPAAAAASGPFSSLPQDALLCILSQLSSADVAHLSQTCKALKAATEDGAVWQLMLARSFPGAKLTASNMADWKAAYLLEAGCVLDELRCWYTRADFEEDVLGLPLSYSVNPVTQKVDYIEAHPDLISVTAFRTGVRQTPTGEKFDALLPLYLTAEHFNHALPHLEPLLKQLAPEHVPRGGGCPPPETWLEVLPKILNTQIVLLADNGITASQRTLAVNCQVYRLLLAVCEHWVLWPKVSARLDTFLQHPANRVKSACPNLGLLQPLLSCSPIKHSWSKFSGPLLEEAMDRKVLWMCKKDPGLVKAFRAPLGSPADMALLHGGWAGSAVSCRLTAFHAAFLQLVAAPRGSTLESVMDSMDAMYGWPAAALGPRFANVVRRIQQLDGWQSWFRLLGRQVPTAAVMSDLLRTAWRHGEKKGYHSASTDFSRIHASGVSKILLKGQSYSTPPGTKSVELEVHYKWKPEFVVRYLDGAVLLFGPGKKFMEMVAWNHQSSSTTARPGAVTHSGDIMEFDNQKGLNKAKVVFKDLGPDVQEAYITLSAWSDAMLSDIIQPYVQLREPSTGVELCQCHLDSKDMVVKRTHKCIIMARLYREPAGGWGVQSVGSFCQGNTGGHWAHGDVMEGNNPLNPVGQMVQGIKALNL